MRRFVRPSLRWGFSLSVCLSVCSGFCFGGALQAYFRNNPWNFGQLFLIEGIDYFHFSFVHVS